MQRLTERHAGVAVFKDRHNLKEAAEKLAKYEEWEENEGWNPIEEPPSDDRHILLSFTNFSIPMIGRYHEGAFYLGSEGTCSEHYLFVNGWRELPKPYRGEWEK